MQASEPPVNPSDSQVRPPSAVPSHSSAPLIAPLPQNEQGVVSKWHCWQARAPLAKPSDAQLAPPSASPSHSSPCEMAPSPQSVGRIAPTPALFCGVGCSSPAQSAAVTPLAPTLCSERFSGVIGVGGPKRPGSPVNLPYATQSMIPVGWKASCGGFTR